jgi:hypothetical protein
MMTKSFFGILAVRFFGILAVRFYFYNVACTFYRLVTDSLNKYGEHIMNIVFFLSAVSEIITPSQGITCPVFNMMVFLLC